MEKIIRTGFKILVFVSFVSILLVLTIFTAQLVALMSSDPIFSTSRFVVSCALILSIVVTGIILNQKGHKKQ